MATYSKAPYISAAVAASGANNSTIYTCPANSYAILNLGNPSGGGCNWTVGGQALNTSNEFKTVYVGPGQAVVVDTSSASVTGYISGVQFTNS